MPKYNPFKPNDIINVGMFVGRVEEIRTVERCLFQTKNGSPQHFMFQGERGIGKSSLLFYINLLANGKGIPYGDEPFRFLSVPIDLGGTQSQLDVVKKVGRGFRQAINNRGNLKERAKAVWNWLTNWEVLGVQFHKEGSHLDLEEIAEQFVSHLAEFCTSTSTEIDGVLFLIDEADRPSVEAGLGAYLKLISERLTWVNCNKVVFGLAGLPTLLGKLRESHESSPRLFHTMLLEPLEMEERKRVVTLGIRDANVRNEVKTEITEDALDLLAQLSEGYPHFVQQFSYSAFERDTDNIIDDEDVSSAAFDPGGALAQLGDKFFSEMYHARISSEEYRRVLDAMADFGDSWIPRRTIIEQSGVSEANVTNALASLKTKQVILQDETRRGFYRLPTNSFAAWINAVRNARAKSDAAGTESPF